MMSPLTFIHELGLFYPFYLVYQFSLICKTHKMVFAVLCENIYSLVISDGKPNCAKQLINITPCLPVVSSGRYPVGQLKTSSDLSFDKQHLRFPKGAEQFG